MMVVIAFMCIVAFVLCSSTSSTSDDEIELDLFTNSLDGIVAFCLTNLPSPVSDFQTARFKMKMTEVDQRSGEVNAENFEVYGSGRDLQVVDDTELCYEVHLDQIRARITYKVMNHL